MFHQHLFRKNFNKKFFVFYSKLVNSLITATIFFFFWKVDFSWFYKIFVVLYWFCSSFIVVLCSLLYLLLLWYIYSHIQYIKEICIWNIWWWWTVFVVWMTNQRRLALFPAGIIVRDPHHRESPTRSEQGLSLSRTWVQAYLNEVAQ